MYLFLPTLTYVLRVLLCCCGCKMTMKGSFLSGLKCIYKTPSLIISDVLSDYIVAGQFPLRLKCPCIVTPSQMFSGLVYSDSQMFSGLLLLHVNFLSGCIILKCTYCDYHIKVCRLLCLLLMQLVSVTKLYLSVTTLATLWLM